MRIVKIYVMKCVQKTIHTGCNENQFSGLPLGNCDLLVSKSFSLAKKKFICYQYFCNLNFFKTFPKKLHLPFTGFSLI